MMTKRQRLRAAVWEMTSGRCEWPKCTDQAAELAHLHSRGMGHGGARDTLGNVMAACWLHARASDFQGTVPQLAAAWGVVLPDAYVGQQYGAHQLLEVLGRKVRNQRLRWGYDLDALAGELETAGNA